MPKRRNAVANIGGRVVTFADDGRPLPLEDHSLPGLARPATSARGPPPLLTVPEAARFLNVSPSMLNKWRTLGGGPVYIRLAGQSIRYRLSDLMRFVDQRARVSTSSELPA